MKKVLAISIGFNDTVSNSNTETKENTMKTYNAFLPNHQLVSRESKTRLRVVWSVQDDNGTVLKHGFAKNRTLGERLANRFIGKNFGHSARNDFQRTVAPVCRRNF